MTEKSGYPVGTAEWKKSAVEWLFAEGLLSDENWKSKIDQPLPLWAQAAVYNRLFQKLRGGAENGRSTNL
ncbi:hypothetical protein [Calidifontibacillus oryziterrae]|uniref:hypothetical protein n=1 Tax=Calidifontibacillus oryziterrae TaxID=1191699 RepID=UPI00031DAE09|nr:hypothetical protein [Calidifontibacillus oryziterrae]